MSSKAECKRCEFYKPNGLEGHDWFDHGTGYYTAMQGATCSKLNCDITTALKDKVDAGGCEAFVERAV
jgi:hypothetical protein